MTSKQRNDVWQAGHTIGAKKSTANGSNQITKSGDTIKHRGENRTIVNNTTHYGSSAAINAIKKLK